LCKRSGFTRGSMDTRHHMISIPRILGMTSLCGQFSCLKCRPVMFLVQICLRPTCALLRCRAPTDAVLFQIHMRGMSPPVSDQLRGTWRLLHFGVPCPFWCALRGTHPFATHDLLIPSLFAPGVGHRLRINEEWGLHTTSNHFDKEKKRLVCLFFVSHCVTICSSTL